MAELGSQAVVLGAGIAGLLAARVLSDFYGSVTVVDRDGLPDRAEQRTGVPQGRHLHSLLSRGTQAIGELFPGLLRELGAAGAVVDPAVRSWSSIYAGAWTRWRTSRSWTGATSWHQ
ncbi:hypothetical protein [Mycolicibacterium sarraceniae]|uniref:Uncharacterized protein n=1 Tax=Mycolicibacterium sarraceniae TaxID=1534348 RepID=A0A7I7SLU0_9MYCO|nr:hypothetical protein [Mycolicibacterium sarraceniae]BBY56975.1 hypothetical protein MSAR_01110 [Mycolicibacterium sarraceniae]